MTRVGRVNIGTKGLRYLFLSQLEACRNQGKESVWAEGGTDTPVCACLLEIPNRHRKECLCHKIQRFKKRRQAARAQSVLRQQGSGLYASLATHGPPPHAP